LARPRLGVQLVLTFMSVKPIVGLACVATLLLVAGKIEANDQPGSCAVYFTVLQNDEGTAHRSILQMNEGQSSWYERNGNRDKYAGICYVENGAGLPADVPLYAMVWGEHPASEPYNYSYEATGPARGTVNGGAVSGTGTRVPVTQPSSETKKHYAADGWLAVWSVATAESQGRFMPIGPLRSRGHGDLSSASAALMKEAMEQISQREKVRLAAIGKGWAVVTITPIENPKPVSSEDSSSTPKSSPESVQPVASAALQTIARKTSLSQSSVVSSAVKVTSTVPGAEIYVDDDFVGNTPSIIDVAAGKHVITVKKAGFPDWARIVDFKGGLVTLYAELGGEAKQNTTTASADPPSKPDHSTEAAEGRGATPSAQKPFGWIGVSTKNDREGALVTDVAADGPAALAGIHVGDVILTLDGRRVKGEELQTLVTAYKPGTRIPVSYASGSSTREVWITVASRD
jgi:hypothetical protein